MHSRHALSFVLLLAMALLLPACGSDSTAPPAVDRLRVTGVAANNPARTQLLVDFNVAVDATSAGNAANYAVADQNSAATIAVNTATVVGPANTSVQLDLASALLDGSVYDVEVTGVTTAEGGAIDDRNNTFAVGGSYSIIDTWAGTGANAASPDGTVLLNAEFAIPMDVSFAPNGTPYIIDWNNHRILEVRNDRVYSIIGTGTLGNAPEGPALDAGLNHPTNIAFDPQGRLIMSAWHNSKIMRYDPTTLELTRICGLEGISVNGNRCYGGDNGPGIEACLDLPSAAAFDSDGYLYIADQKNTRIRRLSPVNGEITDTNSTGDLSEIITVVGTGEDGYNGDGVGTDVRLHAPGGQAAAPVSKLVVNGDYVYFADSQNHLVRRYSMTTNMVETVAGGGAGLNPQTNTPLQGWTGDGGPATDATLFFPADVAFDSAGNLYIADTNNSSVRKVDTAGIITTFAGQGRANPDISDTEVLDGGLPTRAWLRQPYGVAVDGDDNVYITDTYNNRIRIIRK